MNMRSELDQMARRRVSSDMSGPGDCAAKAHLQKPSDTGIKVANAGGVGTHCCIERVRRVWSPAEQVLKHGANVGVLVGPLLGDNPGGGKVPGLFGLGPCRRC